MKKHQKPKRQGSSPIKKSGEDGPKKRKMQPVRKSKYKPIDSEDLSDFKLS